MLARVDSGIRLARDEVSPKLAERLRRALSYPNPAYLDRLRLGLSARGVPERLCFLDEDGDGLRLPRGAIGTLKRLAAVDGALVACEDRRVVPAERLPELPCPPLRTYQERAVDAMIRVTQGTVVVPCGGGKTRIGIGAASRLRTPTLVLVHTLDLAEQWRSEMKALLGVDACLVGDGEVNIGPVTVALVQALCRQSEQRLPEILDSVGLVIVDECLPAKARVIVRGRGPITIGECVQSDGDVEVLSYDHDHQQAEFRKVIGRSRKVVRRRFVTLRIQRRHRTLALRLTEEHPVFVEGRGYVPAIEVRASDNVLALARFYPCPACDAAFDHPSALGGHIQCVHKGGKAFLEGSHQPGGFCPRCGKIYATQGGLQQHIRRHEDPAWDEAVRKANSDRMRATNLRRADILSERMRRRNPMLQPLVREKMRRSHWVRPADGYDHLNGGNGTGPTVPERLLHERLGPGWTWQLPVSTGSPRLPGLPTHYKLDLAHEGARIAVEVDGHSHHSLLAHERDGRKDTWLAAHGWRCLRFSNEEVLNDLDAVAASVLEVLRCST
ncbi:MAG TPA: DUF559 domain-containing protein [Thermoleophilia bacterium]|nr:DUF559 domain-containing protein [Thermoleophilia bacterium]